MNQISTGVDFSMNINSNQLNTKIIVADLWRRLRHNKWFYILSVLLLTSEVILMLGVVYVTDKYFSNFQVNNLSSIYLFLSICLIIMVLLIACNIVGDYLKQKVMASLEVEIAKDIASNVMLIPFDKAQHYHTSDLLQRVTKDSGATATIISLAIDQIMLKMVAITLSSVYLFLLYWPLAVLILVATPFVITAGEIFRKKLIENGQAVATQESIVRQNIQEWLQNIEVIQTLQLQNELLGKYKRERSKLNKLYMKQTFLGIYVSTMAYSIAMILTVVSVSLAAYLVFTNKLQLGSIVAFFFLVWQVNNPMRRIGVIWGRIMSSLGIAKRIYEILCTEKEDLHQPSKCHIENDVEVTVQNVDYSSWDHANNSKTSKILHNINMRFSKGQFIALVGQSGSGKSTCAKLIAGLIIPDKGEVTINGFSTKKNILEARSKIGYVSQSPYLFSGTIKEFLRLANASANEELLYTAAKDACIHDYIISLPMGYDTLINEQGKSLSGGQRQRLAIAQMLVSDRPIMILDEATSGLNEDLEMEIMNNLRRRIPNKILIVITHRLSVIKDANIIYVIQNGIVEESGTHSQLVNNQGIYGNLLNHI